jgi:signal transduction histidine kinase
MLRRRVTHMSRILDDLLDVRRITQGKLSLNKRSISIEEVVDSAVESVQSLIDIKEHRLVVELPRPAPTLNADPVRLAQVISNLLTNSAKYTDPGGTIVLTVQAESATLCVFVRDNGIGIAPEQIPALFTMFSQLESARDRSEGGLGIGLALAKNIIELHGGTLEARSAGHLAGSEFQIRLPLLESAGPV